MRRRSPQPRQPDSSGAGVLDAESFVASEPSARSGSDDADTLAGSPSLETESLVRRARQGETRAWSRLYSLHVERLYKHLGYLTGDAFVAEDLVQEVFASAMISLDRFDGRSSFSTWLFAIARNAVYKHWRSRSRRDRAYKKVADGQLRSTASGHDPEHTRLTIARAEALESVLSELPDNLREAFVLVDLREMAPEEAAELLGITRGNLAVRACRARTRVRDLLAERGWLDNVGANSPEKGRGA